MKLKELVISPCNVRQTVGEDDLSNLQQSIKKHNLISKIVLRKSGEGVYEVVAGQRRYKALSALRGEDYDLTDSDYVLYEDLGDDEAFLLSIEENQQRRPLNPMDLNKAAVKLNHMGKKDKEIARVLNVSPYRLKRLYHLGMDKNKMPEQAQEHLSRPVDEALFNDAHWEKMRDLDDRDVLKDVVSHVVAHESPPREVPTIVKAVQKQYEQVAAGDGASGDGAGDGAPEDPGGPIVYEHKGKLVLEEHGDKKILKVLGKGEDQEVPVEHYLEYLRHPDKFDCRVAFKMKIKPLE